MNCSFVISELWLLIEINKVESMNCGHYQGYNHTDEFILTQHPLEATVGDFWRMVWDNNSSVIVLLSRVEDQVS